MRRNHFATFAWGVLLYNLLVVLWGVTVRATSSGAGCGRHWPLCNGQVVPRAAEVETLVEFTHRLSSGLAGLLVLAMLIWAFRAFPAGHAVRKGATFSLVFIIGEGAVGAMLVLFEWVGANASVARAVSMALHLGNTFLLLSALALTAWGATAIPAGNGGPALHVRRQGNKPWLLGLGLLLLLVVSAAGAVTALGDTLFPPGTLAQGVARDFSPTAHFLERLRIWHPVLAVLSALYLFTLVGVLQAQAPRRARALGHALQLLLVAQVTAGAVNVVLLAPVWLQLLHLLLADAVWIALVLFSATLLAAEGVAAPRERVPDAGPVPTTGTD